MSTILEGHDTAKILIDKDEALKIIKDTHLTEDTKQLILVLDHQFSFWEKDSRGKWKIDFATYCGYGRNGICDSTEKQEGDGRTPSGLYTLDKAFGIAGNPGSLMEYRQVTENSYWSGEKEGYNTWEEVEPNTKDMSASEHLIDYEVPYKYVFNIDYNSHPAVYGKGSAIFLHCRKADTWKTGGCIAIGKEWMLHLLRRCNYGTKILILPSAQSEQA